MRSGLQHQQILATEKGPGSACRGQKGQVPGLSLGRPLSCPTPGGTVGKHSLWKAMCSSQHPVPGQQGPPTEVGPIITQADLPRPPSQAAVLAPHNAVHRQLPAATVCGEVTRKAVLQQFVGTSISSNLGVVQGDMTCGDPGQFVGIHSTLGSQNSSLGLHVEKNLCPPQCPLRSTPTLSPWQMAVRNRPLGQSL